MTASRLWQFALLLYSRPLIILKIVPPHVVKCVIDDSQPTKQVNRILCRRVDNPGGGPLTGDMPSVSVRLTCVRCQNSHHLRIHIKPEEYV